MTLEQIKQAIAEGKKVYWASLAYDVIKDDVGQYLIKCNINGSCVGLTWRDGITMNESEDDFFTMEGFKQ